ncbi:MAG: hypothetical protein QNJ97_26460 [Myxococcota bacterium]|nr:hypothetical protein [Myxococcota bacterium]
MDATSIETIAKMLQATSPYGVLVALAIWYHRVTDRKDREIKELNNKMTDIAERQILALAKVESAILALKDAIDKTW